MNATPETRALLGGNWIEAADGRRFAVENPATGGEVAEAVDCGEPEFRAAIDAAAAAFPAWRDRVAAERGAILRKWAELLLRDRERLARLMTLEQGKPLAEARGEVAYAASFLEWFAEEARRIRGSVIPAGAADKRLLVLQRPVGVTAAITPWNFPLAMITRKAGAALAAGCPMVVKPAELTPLSAIAAGELAVEAGVPAGVLAVVPTSDPVAFSRVIFGDARVRKVSFTGSTEVGKILMQAAAGHVTRLSLELGGHAPLLVFADADLDLAVSQCVASKFRNGGQTCVCANRILVERSVLNAFTERLVAAVRGLKVGDGLDEGVAIGPLIEDSAAAKALAHVADAVAGGAKVLCGGGLVELPGRPPRFVAPTVLAGVRPGMLCCREETFGPVAPVLAFDTEAEAIGIANDTPYGLAAYAFTRDGSRIMRLAEALDYGIVGVNDGLPATAQAPFGGVKESGFGREGGSEGLREYLVERFVSWRVA